MTETQLIQNITKTNKQGSNYYRLVHLYAYYDMVNHNSFVKNTNDHIQQLREVDKIIPGYYKIRNSKGEKVCFTKFTKYLRFRTYKQQFAITVNGLEKVFREHLALKDSIRQEDYLNNWTPRTRVSEFPNSLDVDSLKTNYILVSR